MGHHECIQMRHARLSAPSSTSVRSSLGAVVAVSLLALAACQSASDDATPSPTPVASTAPSAPATGEASPSPSEAGVQPEDVSVFDIEIGDCFTADGDEIESVTVVDCSEPHVYEAYHVLDHGAGADEAYPGDDAILEYADTECQPPFEEFVDFDYETSIWYITSVTPSAATWADGDREIICTLNQQDAGGEPIEVTGSAEGAAE